MNQIQAVLSAGRATAPTVPTADAAAATTDAIAATPPARVAVISASWHREIVDRARGAMLVSFAGNPVPPVSVETFDVPGAGTSGTFAAKRKE